MKLIEEGKADGSIRDDIETALLTYSISFLVTGFFHQLSQSGKTFTDFIAIKEETFSLRVIDMLSSLMSKSIG